MTAAPGISICMMVKNEEHFLPQALDSVKDLADELIVVDTGSTDRTVEIAESYNARIFHHPWENDFSKHRNQTIEYATGEWIFILDADEQLVDGGAEIVRKTTETTEKDVIFLPVLSIARDGKQESTHNSLRLFRRRTGLRYQGAVHNEILWEGPTAFVNARLNHYGYNLSREKMLAKFNRTVGLLKREMERDPENPKYPHYLAGSYFGEKMFLETFEYAEKSHRLCKGDRETEMRWLENYYLLAASLYERGYVEKALETIRYGLGLFPDYLDLYAVMSSIAFVRKDFDLLLEAGTRFLELHQETLLDPARFESIALHTVHHRHLVLIRLAIRAELLDDRDSGFRHYEDALTSASDPTEVVSSMANYYLRSGNAARAEEYLEDGLSRLPGNPDLSELKIRLLLETRRFDDARDFLERVRDEGLPEDTALFLSGIIALMEGRNEDAVADFLAFREYVPERVEALTNLGVAYERLERFDDAERVYLQAIDQDPYKLDASINVGNLYARLSRPFEAIAFLEQVLRYDDTLMDVHLMLARLYWDIEDADRLLHRGRQVGRRLEIDGAETADSVSGLGEVFRKAGERLWEKQGIRAASLAFGLAAQLQPGESLAHLQHGEALLGLNRIAEALGAFERAMLLNPSDWRVYEGLARCSERLEDEDATESYRAKVRELKP